MRHMHLIFALFAALLFTTDTATAQENLSGTFEATEMNGNPVYADHTIYVEVELTDVAPDGTHHYTTRAKIVSNITGEVVSQGQPGSITYYPLYGIGFMVGSIGTEGVFTDLGNGQYQADYSAVGGNTRMWTKL